jgi:hypothetical protein
MNRSGVIKSNLTGLVRALSTGQRLMVEMPLLMEMGFTSFPLSPLTQPILLKAKYTMG